MANPLTFSHFKLTFGIRFFGAIETYLIMPFGSVKAFKVFFDLIDLDGGVFYLVHIIVHFVEQYLVLLFYFLQTGRQILRTLNPCLNQHLLDSDYLALLLILQLSVNHVRSHTLNP